MIMIIARVNMVSLNDLLTNNFENTYGYTQAGIRLRTQKKKYNYAFGANWQNAAAEREDRW
jgi:hypothetical protein